MAETVSDTVRLTKAQRVHALNIVRELLEQQFRLEANSEDADCEPHWSTQGDIDTALSCINHLAALESNSHE